MLEIGVYCPTGRVALYDDGYNEECGLPLFSDADGGFDAETRYVVGYRHDGRCHSTCQPNQVSLLADSKDDGWCPPPGERVFLALDPQEAARVPQGALPAGSWICHRRGDSTEIIDQFRGTFEFLSNVADIPVRLDDTDFPTGEHAFHWCKTSFPEERAHITDAPTWREAKKRGQAVTLVPEWDQRERYAAMRRVLAAKFSAREAARNLDQTGTALLVEGNDWCDQHWGCCWCDSCRSVPGSNYLGRFLMDLRRQRNSPVQRHWIRVACTGHRPQGLPPGSEDWVESQLRRVATKLRQEYGMRVAISGGAAGTDVYWAEAAAEVAASTWVYAPYERQDARWSREWQLRRARVLAAASRVAVLGKHYHWKLPNRRNTWMLRDADALVAVVDPARTKGGTIHAMRAAQGHLPIIRLDVRNRRVTINDPAAYASTP